MAAGGTAVRTATAARPGAAGLVGLGARLNPSVINTDVEPAPTQPVRRASGVASQILRSVGPWYIDSLVPWARRHNTSVPPEGVHEVYLTLVQAIGAARRYVYVEDQYFS